MNSKISTFFLFTALILASCSGGSLAEPDTAPGPTDAASTRRLERIGEIEHPAVTESSGLAVSTLTPDVLWTHNDSGDKPRLFALNLKGEHLATINLKGASAYDWEDLASFKLEGKSYLLIADIGDNAARRQSYMLYAIEEPSINPLSKNQIFEIPVSWKITFTYKEGSRDSEAAAVDSDAGQILILSKRDRPPVLYSLPLRPNNKEPLVAKRLASLSNFPGPLPADPFQGLIFGSFSDQPTAMDISLDRKTALVVTYTYAYLFARKYGQTWAEAFTQIPLRITLPYRNQGESGCFAPDGSSIFLGSEKRPSSLWRISIDNKVKKNMPLPQYSP
jgi:hypothetical protein